MPLQAYLAKILAKIAESFFQLKGSLKVIFDRERSARLDLNVSKKFLKTSPPPFPPPSEGEG
jgi:hypothetical protein